MNIGRRLKRYLLTGVIVLAPLSISLLLLFWFVGWVDRLVRPLSMALVGRGVPGLGIVTAVGLLLAAGWLGSNLIGQQLLEGVEELVLRVPVLSWLYRTAKQLTEIFSPAGQAAFRSVVLVEYPREGVYQLGFATGGTTREGEAGATELTSVYVPTNHLYIGDILLVPKERLRKTSLTLQEGVQFYLSAGASLPPSFKA